MPFPLWLDPDQTVRAALELRELSMGELFHPKGALNYAKAWASAKQMRIFPGDATKTPVVAVLNSDQEVTWQHVGKTLGDYPTIDTILHHVASI